MVDNGSADGSPEMVRAQFPTVRLIANCENLGFGRASNQGVAAATGRYVLLLNSDAVLCPGAIDRLLAALRANPGVGLVGPRLLNADGSVQRSARRFPTPAVLLLEQLSLARLLPVARSDGPRRPDSLPVDWLLGACMLGRRDLLRALGPFDPSFFMYGEDIDLCFRLRATGRGVRLVPRAVVTHLGGGSTQRRRAQLALESTTSMYRFYRKHYGAGCLRIAVVIFRAVALVKLPRDVGRLAWTVLRGRNRRRARRLGEDVRLWLRVLALSPRS